MPSMQTFDAISRSTISPFANVLGELIHELQKAIRKAELGLAFIQETERVGDLLSSLPLATQEYGLAHIHLRNANRYANSGEFGAARWELRAINKTLSRAC